MFQPAFRKPKGAQQKWSRQDGNVASGKSLRPQKRRYGASKPELEVAKDLLIFLKERNADFLKGIASDQRSRAVLDPVVVEGDTMTTLAWAIVAMVCLRVYVVIRIDRRG